MILGSFLLVTLLAFFVILPAILIAFFPRLANMSLFRNLVYLNAAREWIQYLDNRKQNQGRFLTEKEMREVLSPDHKGLVINGQDARLTHDASFLNSDILATHGKNAITIAGRITKKTRSVTSKKEPKITGLSFSEKVHYERIFYL